MSRRPTFHPATQPVEAGKWLRWARFVRQGTGLVAMAAVVTSVPAQARMASVPALEDYPRALECLTLAVAYEAGHETLEGKQAVAEVVLNRLRSASFQNTVCDVVFAGSTRRTGCQFSFTCDGSLRRRLPASVMLAARMVAEDALANRVPPRVAGATHYHASYVTPYWAPSLVRLTRIGAHIFYHSAGRVPLQSSMGFAPMAASAPGTPASGPSAQRRGDTGATFAPWGLGLGASTLRAP